MRLPAAFGPGAGGHLRSPRSLARSGSPKGRAHESCRHCSVGPAVDLLRSVAVPPVLAGPLAGQDGDDRPDRLFGVGLGDRHRQDLPVRAAFARLPTASSRRSGRGNRWRNSTRRLQPSRAIRPARCSSPPCANGNEASKATPARSPACRCASKKSWMSPSRARSSTWSAAAGAGDGRLGRALYRPVRHDLGHHDQLPVDRGLEEHLAGGGRARHCRSVVCDRNRPHCRHSGDDFLQ